MRELIANDPGDRYERERLNRKEVTPALSRHLEFCKALEGLNESQRRAAETCPQKRIQIIWGPPGTGKTKLAAAILQMYVDAKGDGPEDRGSLLAVAQSNVAADNLALRLILQQIRVMRFGDAKVMSQDLLDVSTQMRSVKEWGKTLDELHKESKRSKKGRLQHEMSLMDESDVTCGTIMSSGSGPAKALKHRVVLIDEAAQAIEPETLIAILRLMEGGTVVLIGDHRQLPPTTHSRGAKFLQGVSLFERLIMIPGYEPVLLNIQYRMRQSIARWPSQLFYTDRHQNDPSARDLTAIKGFPWPKEDS